MITAALGAIGAVPQEISRVKGRVVIYVQVGDRHRVIATVKTWNRVCSEVPQLRHAEILA